MRVQEKLKIIIRGMCIVGLFGIGMMFIVSSGGSDSSNAGCDGAPAPVAATGQTVSEAIGDDGDLQMGVALPDPRFTDNTDGTVTDNLTGLIWLKNTNCIEFFSGDAAGQNSRSWSDALEAANSLASGYCGLTDGSAAGDWRLPSVRELHSLIDFGNYNLALPSAHPFTDVWDSFYWSGTAIAEPIDYAWIVSMDSGVVTSSNKTTHVYVWPVRSDD